MFSFVFNVSHARSQFSSPLLLVLMLLASIVLSACATAPTDPFAREEYERVNDPLEPFNRGVFSFNAGVQDALLNPLSLAYNALPKGFRIAVGNFYQNLNEPRNTVNALLQGNPEAAGHSLGRFVANSTVGLGGLIEVTGPENHHPKDFGGTLAVWSGKQSAYLELPLFGSSSVTDALGMVVDGLYSLPRIGSNRTGSNTLLPTIFVTQGITRYAGVADTVTSTRENFSDPYLVLRSSYRQVRQKSIFGQAYNVDSLELDAIE